MPKRCRKLPYLRDRRSKFNRVDESSTDSSIVSQTPTSSFSSTGETGDTASLHVSRSSVSSQNGSIPDVDDVFLPLRASSPIKFDSDKDTVSN